MKRALAIAVVWGWALAGQAQGFAHFPAFLPWTLRWDQDSVLAAPLAFDLFFNGSKIATLTDADYTRDGITNNVTTFSCIVPAVLLGTNLVTLVATDGTNRSAPSLPLTVLGEFPPPRNLRP